MRVSCFILGGGEFGEDHRLVDDLDWVVHGGQLEHRGFGEVAAFAGLPLVVLLDQDRPGKAQQSRGVGEHADDVGAAFDLFVHPLQGYLEPSWGCL